MATLWNQEAPCLLPAFVCYADILGFGNMTRRALESGEEEKFLHRIKHSLNAAYEQVRKAMTRNEWIPDSFDMKVFTDNIVVGYPLENPRGDVGEPEFIHLLMLFAEMQAKLAGDGFFVRGAITFGDHYQDDDIAFGKALLEAVELDKEGGAPRLVIGPSVEPLLLKHFSWYYAPTSSPHDGLLLNDPDDGRLFVDYLYAAFQHFPDGPIDHELLEAHSDKVRSGLLEYASNTYIRDKYEWMATYHNYVCCTFASRYPVRYYSEEDLYYAGEDPEAGAIAEEAQTALEYLIPSEEIQVEHSPPRPLDSKWLQDRLATE